jgi:hypothetical protein
MTSLVPSTLGVVGSGPELNMIRFGDFYARRWFQVPGHLPQPDEE